jgi:hypothetical protein
MQTERDGFDLVVAVEQHELLVLAVALEHGDVLDLAGSLYEAFVELEAGVEVAALGERVDLLDLVEGLIAAAALLDPRQEHGVMEVPDRWRHELRETGVDDLLRFVVEIALEEVADAGDDHLLLVAAGVQVAGVLLEQHDGVVEQFLLSGFVHEVVVGPEDGVVLHAVPEVLNSCRLHLLVPHEDGEADEVELPAAVYGEVVVDDGPLVGDGVEEAEVGLYDLDDLPEVDLVEGEVAPEELVALEHDVDELLDAEEGLLAADDVARAQVATV